MRVKIMLGLVLPLLWILPVQWCLAEVDWQTTKQLNLPDAPIDMTFSRDGQWLYLLTDKKELLIYDHTGEFNAKIELEKKFDRIEPSPYPNEIYLFSRNSKQIQVIEVSHTREIDTSAAPYKGPADAPVVIVDYTDFQCPYCAKLVDIFDQLMRTYPGKLKIVYKSYPLNNHKFAFRAATAAMVAHQKGRFWEFHDRLFMHYQSLNEAKIQQVRQELGFDPAEFNALMSDPEIRAQVARDRNEGQRIGVRGTPTVFVNGKRLKDKRLEGFKAAIEKELQSRRQ